MKITFLGTAAADGIPIPYCDCSTCMHAREHKGRNIRKRCSYSINDDLLIDMGPDLFTACAMHDVDLLETKYTLISHSHLDHICVHNLKLRAKMFRRHTELPPMTLVAPPSVMTLLSHSGSKDAAMELQRQPFLPYDNIDLPPYHIRSVKASHIPAIGDAMNYVIDDGNKKVLIASDTGIYKDEVWPHLKDLQLDGLVIECTAGNDRSANKTHLNIEGVQIMIEKMKEIHAVTEKTTMYATHFSHNHCPSYEELSEMLQNIGVNCAYDGLVLDI